MQSQRYSKLRLQLKSILFQPESTNVTHSIEDEKKDQFDQKEPKNQQLSVVDQTTPKINFPSSNTQKQLEFNAVYELLGLIGQGGHAVVKKCRRWDNPSQVYAVKIYRTGDPEMITIIKRTYTNKVLLKHPSCCEVQELFINEKRSVCYLVQEYCPWPTLEQQLRHKHTLPLDQSIEIIKELLELLVYIHNQGICHRDIKPDNLLILIQDNPKIKLIDFGVSSRYFNTKTKQRQLMWTRTGNIYYQAPELFELNGYNQKVDIWSTGIVFYQMIIGQLPFMKDEVLDTIKSIQTDPLDEDALSSVPEIVKDFLRRILAKQPQQRLDATDCLLHPMFGYCKVAQSKKTSIKDDVSVDLGQSQSDWGEFSTLDNELQGWYTPSNKQNKCYQDTVQPQKSIHHIENNSSKKGRFRTFSLMMSEQILDKPKKSSEDFITFKTGKDILC